MVTKTISKKTPKKAAKASTAAVSKKSTSITVRKAKTASKATAAVVKKLKTATAVVKKVSTAVKRSTKSRTQSVAARAVPDFDMLTRRGPASVSDQDRAASLENLVSIISEESQREHERMIEQSKFDLGMQHERRGEEHTLPIEYGKDRVILLVVDPRFVFTYWEITQSSMEEAQRHVGSFPKLTLRFYDTSANTTPEQSPSWDIEVFDRLGNWYLRLEHPEQTLVIDIGLKDGAGNFRAITRSNYMKLPRPTLAPPGPIMWMVVGPDGEKIITSVEEYTEADLALLKRILGPYFFGLLMRGEFSSIIGSSMEAVFQDIALLKHPGILPSSSPTVWMSSDSIRK